ncbi:threonylcarbamoyl-AMP synthase [Candidatus Peregrinibacteria bacterium]|nr:threonylcarbamoyl-AMP synthase [Candidatus Peregrinibacteria bacterium]
MKTVPFNPDTLRDAVDVLKKGGVIAHSTDTCYGLAADMMNPKAVKNVQAIKGRDFNKPMSIMISVPEQLRMEHYVQLDEFSRFISHHLFPSAVTLLLPKGPAVPETYFPETPLIGLRVPMHDSTQDILRAWGGPLVTTSANPSGEPLCFSHEEVVERFKGKPHQPDLVFEGKITRHDKASTVIKVESDHIRIVRKGPITASQLEGILGIDVKE